MFDLPAPPPHDLQSDTALAPLAQSVLYARAAASLGARVDRMALQGQSVLVLRRDLPILGPVALISRGPPRMTPEIAAALPGRTGAHHVLVNAEDAPSAEALRKAGFRRIARPRQIAELAIDPSRDAMRAGLQAKWRNRLRHAEGCDLNITDRPMPADPDHWLFAADALRGRRKRYRPLDRRLIVAMSADNPDAARLLVARHRGQPVAAMLLLCHGAVATYQIGWTSDRGRRLSAGNLLMWDAMTSLAGRGLSRLDLGAADPACAAGLARFKRGTGAVLRPLGGTWVWSSVLDTLFGLHRHAAQ